MIDKKGSPEKIIGTIRKINNDVEGMKCEKCGQPLYCSADVGQFAINEKDKRRIICGGLGGGMLTVTCKMCGHENKMPIGGV